jgi:hypothetical protein
MNETSAAQPGQFTDAVSAKAYITEHDKTARALNAMSRQALAEVERQTLAAAGQERIFGGPHSKDELINSILDLRFPLAGQAREAYYRAQGVIS